METKTFTEQVRETPTRDLQGNYTKDQLVEPQREMKFKLESSSSTESEMETLKELPCIKSEPASNSESHIRSIKLEQDSNTENSTDQQETVRHSGGFSRELTARLIEECLMRKAEVLLHRLSIHDIEKLRRVRVLVKRTNFREYYREQERPASRGKRSQPHTEDSNASTTTSETKRKKSKRFVHITSDTPTPIAKSLNSENSRFKHFKRFKHITSDSSTSTDQEDRVVRPPSVKRRRGPKFYQTALKIKQKKPLREKHVTADSVVIELSSESRSSSSSPVPMAVSGNSNRFPDVAMPRELDPLYEEAIVPF